MKRLLLAIASPLILACCTHTHPAAPAQEIPTLYHWHNGWPSRPELKGFKALGDGGMLVVYQAADGCWVASKMKQDPATGVYEEP